MSIGLITPGWPPVQDVRVGLRGRDVAVSERLLQGADVLPVFQQVRRERVAQRVGTDPGGRSC